MATDQASIDAASLSYATLDADGLPDVVPDVEAAIARGESVRRIAKHFRRRPLAEKYIAKSFRRRFDLHATDGNCICCNDQTQYLLTVGWFFETRRNFRIGADVSTPLVRTRHSMCEACLDEWWSRQRWARRLFAVAGWSVLLTLTLLLARALFRRHTTTSDGLWRMQMAVIAASIVASVAGTIWWRRTVPRPLRALVPRWMRCSGIESFDLRGDLIAEADAARPIADCDHAEDSPHV